MASSDNVVRAGLTPKLKDVPTLTSMLTYSFAPADEQKMKPSNFQNCCHSTLYDPPIEEFSIVRTELKGGEIEEMGGISGPSILIVTAGGGKLSTPSGYLKTLNEGSIWFIAANEEISLKAAVDMVTYRAFAEVET